MEIVHSEIEMPRQKARKAGIDLYAGEHETAFAVRPDDAAGAVFHAYAHADDAPGKPRQGEGGKGFPGIAGRLPGICVFFLRLFQKSCRNVDGGVFQREGADHGLQAEQGKIAYLDMGAPDMRLHAVHTAALQAEIVHMERGQGEQGKGYLPYVALDVELRFQYLGNSGGQTRWLKPCEIAVDHGGEKNPPQNQKYCSKTRFPHIPS